MAELTNDAAVYGDEKKNIKTAFVFIDLVTFMKCF